MFQRIPNVLQQMVASDYRNYQRRSRKSFAESRNLAHERCCGPLDEVVLPLVGGAWARTKCLIQLKGVIRTWRLGLPEFSVITFLLDLGLNSRDGFPAIMNLFLPT